MTSLNFCPDKSSCHRDDSLRDAELDVNKLDNKLPEELCRLESQVAGHYDDNEKNVIGK
ncbi:hypothetical protein M0802_013118 [Mischocyttarus mexicanus]|nr:hypothetical protein M0802_013118 [Mischocyttarus mexicanus]